MLEVKYTVDHAEGIMTQISQQIDSTINNQLLTSKSESLDARIVAMRLHPSLSCMVSEFESKQHVRVRRLTGAADHLIILDFHVSKKVNLSLATNKGPDSLIFGAYFASTNVGSYADFADENVNKQVAFIIDKQWVADTFGNLEALNQFIQTQQDFFVYKSIDLELANEIHHLHQFALDNSKSGVSENYVFGQALKVLALFFPTFSEEPKTLEYAANAQDVERLMACRDYIHQHFMRPIKLDELARMSTMSESKFRKKFKAVFGKSPYDYIKHLRLWYAKEQLEKGESASQAAYAIGYTNLSHFTRSFKSLFGLTPSEHKKYHAEHRDLENR
ncbi:MAG: AraC family transcriptional regulator [Bacteroidota bacterium]